MTRGRRGRPPLRRATLAFASIHRSPGAQRTSDPGPHRCSNFPFPVRRLVVHPLNECNIWRGSDAETARRAMAPAAAPDEWVLVLVPVCGGTLDGLLELGPGVEAPPFEGQRAQHLPPRLDEVQVGRVLWLEDELPAWMGQGEQQHVHAGVDVEVVDHGV